MSYTYHRSAAVQRLDLAWVESLRKDFLVLLKNLPKIKDYNTGHQVKDALRVYMKNFDDIFFERFLNKDLKYSYDLSESDVKYIDKKLRTVAWSFYLELNGMPLGHTDQYSSKEACFGRYLEKFPPWEAKLRRCAQVFWKEMKEVVSYMEGILKKHFEVKVPTLEKTVVEGFQLLMEDFNPGDDYNEKQLVIIQEGLRLYRRRAAAVAPILLKKQLPINIDFNASIGAGGTYRRTSINLSASSVGGDKGPPWVAHVIAHEMGHHIWQSFLGSDAQNFWYQTIRGDYGDLDIAELLKKWPHKGNDTDTAWAFEMTRYLGNTDPVLALQVEALGMNEGRGESGPQTKEDFQKLFESGTRTLKVPKTPITGYANKNPEEAFCETMGILIAYGPRVLDPKVLFWLETTLPGEVKVASTLGEKVAFRYFGATLSDPS